MTKNSHRIASLKENKAKCLTIQKKWDEALVLFWQGFLSPNHEKNKRVTLLKYVVLTQLLSSTKKQNYLNTEEAKNFRYEREIKEIIRLKEYFDFN